MAKSNELTDADLDIVRGAEDPNYKYCEYGPAGAGCYPNYVPCDDGAPTLKDIYQSWADLGKRFGGKA